MSNVRKRNRRLAARIAEYLWRETNSYVLWSSVAMLALGGMPRKPMRSIRKGTEWRMYPTHSQGRPAVSAALVERLLRRMAAREAKP